MSVTSVYLDHNATTPLHPEVKTLMKEVMDEYGNPSSMHQYGRQARQLIEEARSQVAALINATPDEIVFMGSGSEANNTVLSMLTCPLRGCSTPVLGKPRLLTSVIEHPCILETAKCIAGQSADVEYVRVDSRGLIDMDDFRKKLTRDTLLVSIMMANNEIGSVQDIQTIAEMTKKQGTIFHTDAVQAVGKIPVDVTTLPVDFLSMSAHKIYGPKGVGALYIRKGAPFCPLIHGGHQEQGRRAGTENTLGIVGMGKAAEMRLREMDDEAVRLRDLKKYLMSALTSAIEDIHFISDPGRDIPGTLSLSFPGIEGEAILLYLDLEGIMVSTGSACASGSLDPSYVILSTGQSLECAHGSIRISMGRTTSKEEIDYTVGAFARTVERLRKMTTYTRGVRS
ncbi:cysteine desulfurase [bacterium]|nr:cysteine desulfurase [bacterium]